MSNVVQLSGQPFGVGNGALVEILRDMLAKAESGELQSLLGVGHTSDHGILSVFTEAAHEDYFAILGALEELKAEFMRRQAQ